jgi:hypothetical protein
MEDSLTNGTEIDDIPIASMIETFPGLPTEPLPIKKLDDFEPPTSCHTSSTNFVSSIIFDNEKNLDIEIENECKQDIEIQKKNPGLPTEPLPIQKLDDFESPSISKTFPGLPTEPLPIQKLDDFESTTVLKTYTGILPNNVKSMLTFMNPSTSCKTFECILCPYKFGHKEHLDRHIAAVHEKKKPFECTLCPRKFGLEDHLNKHIAWCH